MLKYLPCSLRNIMANFLIAGRDTTACMVSIESIVMRHMFGVKVMTWW